MRIKIADMIEKDCGTLYPPSTLIGFTLSVFPGNGYIEEKELESFFKELEMSWRGQDVVSSGRGNNAGQRADQPGFTSSLSFW